MLLLINKELLSVSGIDAQGQGSFGSKGNRLSTSALSFPEQLNSREAFATPVFGLFIAFVI